MKNQEKCCKHKAYSFLTSMGHAQWRGNNNNNNNNNNNTNKQMIALIKDFTSIIKVKGRNAGWRYLKTEFWDGFLVPKEMPIESAEGPTLRNFIIFTVHLI